MKNEPSDSQCSACLPISSASSRLAASSGSSPSLVELAGGDLEQVGDADRLARLAHEPQLVAVEHDDADRAGVGDELALDLLAVLVAERVARSTSKNLPSKIVSVPMRSKWELMRRPPRRAG